MKPRELFTVLVKVLGVWEVVSGLKSLPNLLSYWLGGRAVENHSEVVTWLVSMLLSYNILPIAFGVAMFFGADWFARMVYPATAAAAVD